MSERVGNAPILYFDTSALAYYRSQRTSKDLNESVLGELNSLFERSEQGIIICRTTTFTRTEMFNAAKRAAYAVQEIAAGRTDLKRILDELERPYVVQAAQLAHTREALDQWFEDQVGAGRLQLTNLNSYPDIWSLAEIIMEQTSIEGTGDCLHVAAAILLGCTTLVAQDRQLIECVQKQIFSEGQSRQRIQSALAQLTGVNNDLSDVTQVPGVVGLSFKAQTVHDVYLEVMDYLRSIGWIQHGNMPAARKGTSSNPDPPIPS